MALSVVVIKKSVSQVQEGIFMVTLNMKYLDGTTVLIDRDFSERWKVGQSITSVGAKFLEKMQAAITIYKSEQAKFTAVQLDTMVSTLQGSLGV